MNRTNIYLDEDIDAALRVRARAAGTTKSAVIRDLLRSSLRTELDDEDVRAALAEFAEHYHEIIEGMFDDDPDLCIER